MFAAPNGAIVLSVPLPIKKLANLIKNPLIMLVCLFLLAATIHSFIDILQPEMLIIPDINGDELTHNETPSSPLD